ncbi:hypothetical protein RclHR1_19040009 [Rhizophagus clarus]|uniref:SAM domain-containing protein n=1 Tax=Rhizophagus clarus TaxID=94130 RepID=A0A2Z6RGN9_9GLOM|nr:hypothetical protein RclHR1_19040009 [Rhizophagus clarus]
MRNGSRVMIQCLCDIKTYINGQYSLSRTEIFFYLTPESNTILSEPNNHIKSAISETSTPYISASISTTVAGNETVSLADEIKKYDTAKLIEFLQGQENLGLNEPAIKILENEEVNGLDFFDLTEEKLERHGMKMGPATRLVKFAKECKDKRSMRSPYTAV